MFDFFRSLPMFSDIPNAALETLCQQSSTRHYRKNHMMIEQESSDSTVFFIQSGFIKMLRMDDEGRECIHRIAGEGFVLPGTSLFYHDPLPEFVYCLTDVTVIEIPQQTFEQWIEPFSKALIQLAGEMNRRLYHMYEWSHQIAVSDVHERVCYFLEELITTYGRVEADGVHVTLPLTQAEIAQMLGVRRESVNRIWNELRRKQVLQLHKASWVVSHDWQTRIS